MKKQKPKISVCEKCKHLKDYSDEAGQKTYACGLTKFSEIIGGRPLSMEWNPEAEDGLAGNHGYARFSHNVYFEIPAKCPYILEHTIK